MVVFMCKSSLISLPLLSLQVSDVSALAELRNLQTLHLDSTGVQENSLQRLATHPSLSALSLAGIPVADGNHTLEIISGETHEDMLFILYIYQELN